MDVAKAMVSGGELIRADECDYYSYINLGLRCLACGEPVYLKKGCERKAHFAHFKGTYPKQVEECEFRASVYGNSTQIFNINFIEDKEQRLEIFQKCFLNIITKSDPDFYKKVTTVCAIIKPKNLEKTIKECSLWFRLNKKKCIKSWLRFQCKDKTNEVYVLQSKILDEAIDYLCVESSKELLEKLIYYGIYNSTSAQNFSKIDICYKIIKFIACADWIKEFSEIERKSYEPSLNKVDQILSIAKLFRECPYCNKIIGESKLKEHITRIHKKNKNCDYRYEAYNKKRKKQLINCAYCSISVRKDKLEKHLQICSMKGRIPDQLTIIYP